MDDGCIHVEVLEEKSLASASPMLTGTPLLMCFDIVRISNLIVVSPSLPPTTEGEGSFQETGPAVERWERESSTAALRVMVYMVMLSEIMLKRDYGKGILSAVERLRVKMRNPYSPPCLVPAIKHLQASVRPGRRLPSLSILPCRKIETSCVPV